MELEQNLSQPKNKKKEKKYLKNVLILYMYVTFVLDA